jgi:hypothetical protein
MSYPSGGVSNAVRSSLAVRAACEREERATWQLSLSNPKPVIGL